MLVMADGVRSATSRERGQEVAVAELALVDVGVGGAARRTAGRRIGGRCRSAVGRSRPRNHLLTRFASWAVVEPTTRLPRFWPRYLALAALPSTTYSASRSTWYAPAKRVELLTIFCRSASSVASTAPLSPALVKRAMMSLRLIALSA